MRTTMTSSDLTLDAPNPADSVLFTLARAAMASGASIGHATWPHLDLSDPTQREFGDYELLEEIGRGGMGVVYRAWQKSLEREVAIKFIATGLADTLNVSRFLSEARAAAKLMHPNIVPVHEVGSIDGLHYFSMPLVKGRTLSTLLEAGPAGIEDTVALMLKLCDAIGYAHRLGLLHLDLKPSNVLIDERGEPLIADFGLARHMDASGEVQCQEVSGTPAYMAPEQILIKQYRLTQTTDIYALGAILYRALSGRSPHGEGNSDALTQRAIAGHMHPLREVAPGTPRDLSAVTMHCLELLQADRYTSASALADDLRRVRDGLPVSVRQIGLVERMQRWFKREPKLAFASTTAVLALIAGIGTTSWQWREAESQRDMALAQREQAVHSAALGAFLYAHQKDGFLAKGMFEWLKGRFPNDDKKQSDILMDFTRALSQENHRQALSLLKPVAAVVGREYRLETISGLSETGTPDNRKGAALLAYSSDDNDKIAARQFSSLLDKALGADPADPMLWEMAATFCTRRCSYPQATQRMIELEPENAFAWLLRVESTDDPKLARSYLHEAALRQQFNDHDGAFYTSLLQAYRNGGVPLPPMLIDIGTALWPGSGWVKDGATELAWITGMTNPLPTWEILDTRCNPDHRFFQDTSAYEDCKVIGLTMAHSASGMLVTERGADLARRLSKGTPIEQEMIGIRRRQSYISEMEQSSPHYRSTVSNLPMDAQSFFDDWLKGGEMHARSRQLEQFGIPGHPPAHWKPKNPISLMLPEDQARHETGHPGTKATEDP